MREFNKGITVSIITILTFSCSGFRLEQIDIVEIINKCQEQETETHVLLTDYSFYHAYNTSLGFRHRINRVKAQQLIDISKPQNQAIIYLFPQIDYPAVATISSRGLIKSIQSLVSDNSYTPTHQEQRYINNALMGADLLFTNSEGYYEEIIDSLNSTKTNDDDFFLNYLLSNLSQRIGNELNAELYRQNCLSIYQRSPEPLVEALVFEMAAKDTNGLSFLEFIPDRIDFGTVLPGSEIQKTVSIRNLSTNPAYLLHAQVSCSCISVYYPSIILPGQKDTMVIRYNADNKEKKIHQYIMIYANSINKLYNIIIIGEQKNEN